MKRKKQKDERDSTTKRLDALIRLFIETKISEVKEEFNTPAAARILKSAGLTPTEIARIMGKKSRTDISKYLYQKFKK